MSEIDNVLHQITNADTLATAGPIEPPPNIYVAPHIAANVVEMLKRVQTTGFEAFALVEAVTLLSRVASPPPPGPGVPFVPR